MIILQGKGVSSGIVAGRLKFFRGSVFSVEKKPATDIGKEIQRFMAALESAKDQLEKLAADMMEKIGRENALLFEIHKMLLEDPDYYDPIINIIKNEWVCAEYAVMEAGKQLAMDFVEMDDVYMRERAADIDDVSKRVIGILSKIETDIASGEDPVILAADDFSPSETARLNPVKALALVCRQGAANSHTAIFARTMGIPAIIGIGLSLSPEMEDKEIIVDGESGMIYIEPDAVVLAELEMKRCRIKEEQLALETFRGKCTLTGSGRIVKLYANGGSINDVEAALAADAEGIGLFRSEFLYLERNDYPSENIQYESYRKIAERMQDKPVIIRTLDIGADKQGEYFQLPKEENPALGMRAIRLCLTRPAIFKTQLRAIYRASAHGNIFIMFPMINDVEELRRSKEITREVRQELEAEKIVFNPAVPIGIMVETPAAALISDRLALEVDFFSIGTNDLIQYTLAVDRQNESIRHLYNTRHEAVLRLIRMTVENAHKAGIWVGICGTLGGDFTLTKEFIEMGLDEFSVEPSCVLKLRAAIAEC
jgi:phosphotransferase system enzyme I (PtsI)